MKAREDVDEGELNYMNNIRTDDFVKFCDSLATCYPLNNNLISDPTGQKVNQSWCPCSIQLKPWRLSVSDSVGSYSSEYLSIGEAKNQKSPLSAQQLR